MRDDNILIRRQHSRLKKWAHWSVLTVDDLSKTNPKYTQLVAQLKASYQTDKELEKERLKNN
jgi:RNA processing factor Prp31